MMIFLTPYCTVKKMKISRTLECRTVSSWLIYTLGTMIHLQYLRKILTYIQNSADSRTLLPNTAPSGKLADSSRDILRDVVRARAQ
jgi:hypothetical protein